MYTVLFTIAQPRFLGWPIPAQLLQGRELGKNPNFLSCTAAGKQPLFLCLTKQRSSTAHSPCLTSATLPSPPPGVPTSQGAPCPRCPSGRTLPVAEAGAEPRHQLSPPSRLCPGGTGGAPAAAPAATEGRRWPRPRPALPGLWGGSGTPGTPSAAAAPPPRPPARRRCRRDRKSVV